MPISLFKRRCSNCMNYIEPISVGSLWCGKEEWLLFKPPALTLKYLYFAHVLRMNLRIYIGYYTKHLVFIKETKQFSYEVVTEFVNITSVKLKFCKAMAVKRSE
jgi:hypothetical protein